MKFLFVSQDGLIHDLAWEVRKEGHEVLYVILSKAEQEVANGIVNKAEKWEDHKDWADVIIFDDSSFGSTCEELRKDNKLVVGGTAYTDKLEFDRDFGTKEMKASGLNTIPSWEFTNFDAAIEFIKKNPERYVVKPSGDAQSQKVFSYTGQEEDGLDIIHILEQYKKSWFKSIKSFQIQKFISGVEIAIGAFFNGKDFILPLFINFEHKRLMNDEIGPSTGEMGTSGFWSGENKFYYETLAKIRDRIQGFVGYFDINCIVNARGIYPLEVTPRFGYPTINLHIEGITSKWGEFLHALSKGEPFNLNTKRGLQVAVVLAVPPYPFTDPKAFQKFSEDIPVIFKKPTTEGVHPCDIKIIEGEWILTGHSGYALVVTGSGPTMEDARKETYRRIKNILIPNMFYRTDIGERWARDRDLLQTWSYLSSMNPKT